MSQNTVYLTDPRMWKGSYAPDWVFALPGMSSTDKLVFLVLMRYYNRERGCAWPSQQRLAQDCGRSVAQIERAIRRLRDNGYITITATQSTNRYRFPFHPDMRNAKQRGKKPTADLQIAETTEAHRERKAAKPATPPPTTPGTPTVRPKPVATVRTVPTRI